MSDVSTNGTPIAVLKMINPDTGEATLVYVKTCTEAVICPEGKTVQEHLEALYGHASDEGIHLTVEQKAAMETKAGAQSKATTAKTEAIAEASLLVTAANLAASDDATAKSVAARDAAYKYAQDLVTSHADKTNAHGVTAELISALPAIKDPSTGCYYYLVNGKKEWINPPMELGVEYRTARRHMGKVVYEKYIDLGELPVKTGSSNAVKWLDAGAHVTNIIDWNATVLREVKDSNGVSGFVLHRLPYIDTADSQLAYNIVFHSENNIVLQTLRNIDGIGTLKLWFCYTKD